jgi:hypothetical protein
MTAYVPGTTARVTGVVLFFRSMPLTVMLAPGAVEVICNLPSGAGICDARGEDRRNVQVRSIADAPGRRLALTFILRGKIAVGKVSEEHDAQQERVEMGLLGPVRIRSTDIAAPILQNGNNK